MVKMVTQFIDRALDLNHPSSLGEKKSMAGKFYDILFL